MVKKNYYYHKLTDDVVSSNNQDYCLPEDYTILPQTLGKKTWNKTMRPIAHIFALLYTKTLRIHVLGTDKLDKVKNQGYFVYGNHTQPLGDVFVPLTFFPSKNYYALAHQSNWSLPFVGKYVLPFAGLPVGKDLKQTGKLIKAIKTVIIDKKGIITIYPEAHVWPYYTKIRPFSSTSMHFPVALKRPSFTITTTYQQPKSGKKPSITIFIDGPFYPDTQLSKKAAQTKLHQQIYQTMQKRSQFSDYQYCNYQKLD